MNDDDKVPGHTVCGIYCSMCKRRLSKNIPPTLTNAEIDKITKRIEAKHMEWHRSKLKVGWSKYHPKFRTNVS